MKLEHQVHIISRKGKKNLYLRYTDPVTGRRHERSSGTSSRRQARHAAAALQAELITSGTINQDTSWDTFRDEFLASLSGLSPGYINIVSSTFNVIEDSMRPDRVTRLSTAWLERFRAKMQREGKEPATIHKYFQHLGTALDWAVERGYLARKPKFPKQAKNASKSNRHMKGRPPTVEEFERMLAASWHESITYLMNGLWLSGLRIGESMSLTWDRWADGIRLDIDGDDVFLMIDSGDQKNRKTQLYPVVDEFASFLLETPPAQREGFVFRPVGKRGKESRRVDTVSKWIASIGEAAGVKVDQKDQTAIYASAHDFRRAFGTRWSRIVPPMVLRDLMRHASVETTEQFYVDINAREILRTVRKFESVSKTAAKR